MKNIQLYVTDLDGTLLNENAVLSKYSRDELNRLLKTEKITFFTARSYCAAKKILAEVNWNLPCVVNNGAFIVDYKTGDIMEGVYIDNRIVKRILSAAEKLKLSFIMMCMYRNEEKMIYSPLNNQGIYRYIEQRKEKSDQRLLEWKDDMDIDELQIFSLQFVDCCEKLRALQKELEKFDVRTYLDKEIYIEGYYYLNINNKEATKENALLKMVKMLGIPMENVMTFGDQINDLRMLKVAGIGVAVENGNDELKKEADVIIGANVENSVVKYIREVAENQKSAGKVVFWDCDGTILHQNESFRDSLVKALTDNGYEITESEAKEHLKRACSWYFPEKSFTNRTGELWWEDLFSKLTLLLDIKKVPADMRKKLMKDFKDNVICFPYVKYEGVADILSYCKMKGYHNFLLSSNFPELNEVITRLGWDEYFDGYCLSSVIGYEKPRKELYLYAYEQAGKPTKSYMIGDNPIADMKGAKSAGMCTVLVHQRGEKYSDADYSVEDMAEIKEIIKD